MSIDVFGRVLDPKNGGVGARGPPGEGFQRTPQGDFDISYKRLCNVATPQEDLDAVNLQTLRKLRQELITVQDMVKSLQSTLETAFRQWQADLEGVKSLTLRNAELIGQLDRYRYTSIYHIKCQRIADLISHERVISGNGHV